MQSAGHREQRIAFPEDHLRDGLAFPHGAPLLPATGAAMLCLRAASAPHDDGTAVGQVTVHMSAGEPTPNHGLHSSAVFAHSRDWFDPSLRSASRLVAGGNSAWRNRCTDDARFAHRNGPKRRAGHWMLGPHAATGQPRAQQLASKGVAAAPSHVAAGIAEIQVYTIDCCD